MLRCATAFCTGDERDNKNEKKRDRKRKPGVDEFKMLNLVSDSEDPTFESNIYDMRGEDELEGFRS